jgi:hypothetical protein
MKWAQVDQALQFLEQSGDTILLQVPQMTDVQMVVDYIICTIQPGEYTFSKSRRCLEFGGFRVLFESLSAVNGNACLGFNPGQAFLIERDHDPYLPGVELD